MVGRLFGTDGVRGVAGEWPLDPPTVARIGAAIVRAKTHGHSPKIIVGRDTRESGEWIERELARGARSEGAEITSAGVVPTPAIAFLAATGDFDLGIVLSASHNPYADNGIKVFSGRGEKFGEADERVVEAEIADEGWQVPPGGDCAVARTSVVAAYLDTLRRLLPDAGHLKGARVAVDMANGATTTTAVPVLEALGFDVVRIGADPDGRNINLHCGSTHPEMLMDAVVTNGCRFGAAFDGDGDRAILVDARGRVVDGDAMLLILARDYQSRGRLAGETVVATVMSNIGLEIALTRHGIRLIRTPVGDKHVMEAMLRDGYVIGGEQSGHVILAEHLMTGDGLATTLAIMRVMATTGRELDDLAAELVTYPQTLLNVRVKDKEPVDSVPAIREAIRKVEREIDGRGRVLIRYSGTEPLLRIMIEGQEIGQVEQWAEDIAVAVRGTLAP